MKEEQKGYYHPDVIARRESLLAETDRTGRLVIDRACFIKTAEEKALLKESKKKYKKTLR
jgi:hypothetical protein